MISKQAPPEPKYVAFRGTSRTLGGTTPPLVSEATTASAVTLETAPEPLQGLVVDEAKPSTAIQVSFSAGCDSRHKLLRCNDLC
jgi:UBX domain-containing protein 1